MTEKRFYVDKSPVTHLFVPYDREKKFVFEGVENGNTIMKLVGLLNNALEENKQLLKEKIELEVKLYKTNEELLIQADYDQLIKENGDNEVEIINLKKEREELLSELKIYRSIANCLNCSFHNYNWFEDGDEFEVCDKGNDVTEGICKDWEDFH